MNTPFKHRYDLPFLIAFIIAVLTYCTLFIFYHYEMHVTDILVFTNGFMFWTISTRRVNNKDYLANVIDDPISVMRVESNKLFVAGYVFDADRIKKVEVDSVDDKGLLNFPFNHINGQMPMLVFPKDKAQDVIAFLKQQMPHTQIQLSGV